MRWWLILVIALLATGCAASPSSTKNPRQANYPDLGPAPDLEGDTWLNTDTPLRLADLRGKVVLVDMWTFG